VARKRVQDALSKLDVTSYVDYRVFLGDLYKEVKASEESYSYLTFAEDLGFSAINIVRLVIAGKRMLAAKSAATVAEALELRRTHRRYFLTLVAYNNAKGAQLREKLLAELTALKSECVESTDDKRRMAYFGEWSRPVIRELMRVARFRDDPEWIAKVLYPAIRTRKVETTLAFLAEAGWTRKDPETGRSMVADDQQVTLPEDPAAEQMSLARFHEEMLDVARECLTKVPTRRREFNAMTLCVSQATLAEMKKRMRAFCAELMALEAADKGRECVAQVNLQMFALTKPMNEDEP
jgi:uncharacterized protein (TIGR02147 family)